MNHNFFFFFSSRRRHTRLQGDWSSDVCSSDLDIAQNLEMTDEFCDILDLAFSRDFFSYSGKHYQMPNTHIPARTRSEERRVGKSVDLGGRRIIKKKKKKKQKK